MPPVQRLSGNEYNSISYRPTIAFVYHPDCGDSQSAAPQFNDFAKAAISQELNLRVIEINVSEEDARDQPE